MSNITFIRAVFSVIVAIFVKLRLAMDVHCQGDCLSIHLIAVGIPIGMAVDFIIKLLGFYI